MDTGSRLKLVRESYKLSQRELARRSGVTNATISLIEQNRVSPSVSSLKKLLEGIPMSLADFFTFDQPPREHQYVFRANEQPDLGRHGLRLLLIGASVPSRQMRLLREQYAPGASSGEEPIVHSEGEECGLVTRGTETVEDVMRGLGRSPGPSSAPAPAAPPPAASARPGRPRVHKPAAPGQR